MLRISRTTKIVLATAGLVLIMGGVVRTVQPSVSLFRGPAPLRAELTIVPPDLSYISIFSLDAPRVDPKFLDLFERMGDDWAYFRPYAVVVSNQMEQALGALGLAWTVTNAAGKSTTSYTVWDGFYKPTLLGLSARGGATMRGANPGARGATPAGQRAGNPLDGDARGGARAGARGLGRGGMDSAAPDILMPQAQLLASPARCPNASLCGFADGSAGAISAGLASLFGSQFRGPEKAAVADMKGAARVSVEIDLLVTSDGHVWGPDRARAIQAIQARRAAIQALTGRARQVMDEKGDLDAFLAQAAASTATPQTDLTAYFLAGHARFVGASTAPRQLLQELESLPPLPMFVRN